MGVPKLFSTLKLKYNCFNYNPIDNYKLDILYIDGNAMLYPISDIIKHKSEIVSIFIDTIKGYYNKYLCTIYVCMDGPAHMAKIKHQRSRRFEYEPIKSDITTDSEPFSKAMFTPGTDMMLYIDTELSSFKESWFKYSSSDEMYEGEHKIFDYIRNSSDKHIGIVGKDADLILIGMGLTELYDKNIYIYRHDDKHNMNLYSAQDDMYVIDLTLLRTKIMESMVNAKSIWDFIIVTFIFGNDFLPCLAEYNDLYADIDLILSKCISIYDKSYSGYINWTRMYTFLESLLINIKEHNYKDIWIKCSNYDDFEPLYYYTMNGSSSCVYMWCYMCIWNMYYYHDGPTKAPVSWQYPYIYGPSLKSIIRYNYIPSIDIDKEQSTPLNKYQALAAVLPPWLHILLPFHIKSKLNVLKPLYPYIIPKISLKNIPDIPVISYEKVSNL